MEAVKAGKEIEWICLFCGSTLIKALKKGKAGREIFMYTDSNCIYQFYDHRGFTREEAREIQMELQGKKIPLTCMLYSIRL